MRTWGLKNGVPDEILNTGPAGRWSVFNSSGITHETLKTELQAALEASPRASVPFNKLVLSTEHQVRAAGTTPRSSIAELAASILQNNILQNLIVVKGAHGMFEVCAGGRRLEALTLLVNGGDLPTNYPVPVLIVPVEQALISSLSENTLHVPMHPADEYAAFAKLIGEGKWVEDLRCLLRADTAGGQTSHETGQRIAQVDDRVSRRRDRTRLPDGAGVGR